MKEDKHGQYREDAGSPHPVTEEEMGYTPCNAVLKFTFERYGERRYCTGMAESNFKEDGLDWCKHHKSRQALMEQHEENFKTGAYSKSHQHTFQYLPPHKQLLANDLYKSLLDDSVYDFDCEDTELRVDVSDDDFAPDVDTLVLDHPIPTEKRMRGKALWFAALDFVKMESIHQEQFRVAAEDDHEGRELAVGETTTYVSTDDDFKEVAEEHHLNLPLSRIQKDYERHLAFGGVEVDAAEDDGGDIAARDWALVVGPEEEPEPEATPDDGSALTDIEIPEPDDDD